MLLAQRPMLRNSPVEIHTDIAADLWLDSYPGPLGQVLGNLSPMRCCMAMKIWIKATWP